MEMKGTKFSFQLAGILFGGIVLISFSDKILWLASGPFFSSLVVSVCGRVQFLESPTELFEGTNLR